MRAINIKELQEDDVIVHNGIIAIVGHISKMSTGEPKVVGMCINPSKNIVAKRAALILNKAQIIVQIEKTDIEEIKNIIMMIFEKRL